MARDRVVLEVSVDLDPVPGTFYDAADWQHFLIQMLAQQVPHYHPVVSLRYVLRKDG